MKKNVFVFFLAFLMLLTSLNANKVYATLNGVDITTEDVELVLKNPNIKFDTLSDDIKEKVISKIIDKKLLAKKAILDGIEKSELFNKFKEDLALEVWISEEFKRFKVDFKDLKKYYDNNKTRFKEDAKLEARHILVDDEKLAKSIIKDIENSKNKKEKFIELAKSKSKGPTGKDGGYLGKFAPSNMVKEFSQAALALKVGTYTKEPVKTQFGYHIIFLEDKIAPKIPSFSQLKDKLEKELKEKEFTKKIEKLTKELRKKAKIILK